MSSNGAMPASKDGAARHLQGGASANRTRTAWRVIHACEYARDVLPVVEGQIAAGMRPYLVTPQGAGTAELYLARPTQEPLRSFSLLRSWQDVRNWRKSILECDPENSADLVHAHAFAAGMAAVRCCGCVVYDLTGCIEELAIAAHLCEPGSWMGRSFRVAEQFILSRASAVVVHSNGMKEAALERGAARNSIFVIPEPLAFYEDPQERDDVARYFAQRLVSKEARGNAPEPLTRFFVPEFAENDAVKLPSHAELLLEAFGIARQDSPELCMVLEAPENLWPSLNELGAQLSLADNLQLVNSNDASQGWQNCDVVIATAAVPQDAVLAKRANEICLKAMVAGKPLLAADVPRHRDVSPDGRGCLWFDPDDARDLGHRISFLAFNPEFRSALGAAGHTFITESRSLASIGAHYDAVYRHALSRKKTINAGPGMAGFQVSPNFT
jgi:glycosyltransferase involved in cell wall biosynthesis